MTASQPVADDLSYDRSAVDDTFQIERTFSRDDVLAFAAVSGDYSPLHIDPTHAAATECGGCVIDRLLLASLISQLVGMGVPGKSALYLGQDLVFRRPIHVGETVRASARITSESDATRTLTLATEICTVDGKIAVSGSAKVKVRDDPRTPARDESLSPPMTTSGRKITLVTGASRGIGAEIARELARRGMGVAVNYLRSAERAARVVDEIRRNGGEALAVQADVREADDVARMWAVCEAKLGDPAVLVNGAIGELGQRNAIDLRWDDLRAQLDYEVKATFQLCQAAYPGMKRRGGGAIVNLASQVLAGVPPPQMLDYVTAKHALVGLSKALAAEWAADGIRVNVVSPGLTCTDLTQFHHERVFKGEAVRTPLRRLATPADIAHAVAYPTDDAGSFLTGTNRFVTGGQVML